MDLETTWQQVGVISDVAGCFQQLGISIDLLSSSQSHVTITLDPAANQLSDAVLDALKHELAEVGTPRIESPASSVSLVGTSIADVLHEMGPLLENFEHENVHMLSHAANDLSLTLVVDQRASDQLLRGLHAKLFGAREPDADLGSTWWELEADAEKRKSG
jgi:diaminopimelate decarboxylase/aspartate kinase